MSARAAVVAGASGLVGGFLVDELLRAPDYERVTILVRRRLPRDHAKLRQVVVDYDRLDAAGTALAADDAFCCLGTTRAKAGSAAAFRRVDFDAVEEFARLAQLAGAKQYLLVSSSGADAGSRLLYPRVKGESEEAVSRLPFDGAHVFRPSLLLGSRAESRPLERLAQALLSPLLPLMGGPLRRWRPIPAEVVARAMVRWALRDKPGVNRLENELIAELGSFK